jgi:tRNA (guanine37-N1)-methyltransferase
MKVEPLRQAIQAARGAAVDPVVVVYLSPQGRLLDQAQMMRWSQTRRLMLVAGRYEGVDERLIRLEVDEEWSIGDYVLSGGELAALVVFDAVTRLLPGVLGDEQSSAWESHMQGLLDCPHFTRPEEVAGLRVPDVLIGGNHAEVERWRRKQSLGRTWLRRPELVARYALTTADQQLLDEFKQETEIAERG